MLKKFWIVTNDGKDTNHAVTEKVKELLEIAGRSCILCERDAEKNIIRERIPDMIDCAIVIGGDGSLIEVEERSGKETFRFWVSIWERLGILQR